MADNTKEIAELEARAKALRSEKNRQQANELGELQVQHTSLARQVEVAKKGMDDANRAVERAHTEAADMEKWAVELERSAEKNEISNPKKAEEDREQAEWARNAAVRAEREARVARAEADDYRTRHADLSERATAAYQKVFEAQTRLGRAESLGIDPIEEKARLLRESDRLEKAAKDLELSIEARRDLNVSAKVLKEDEANIARMRAKAAQAEADAAKVKINEEVLKESGLETPVIAPSAPVATAEAADADVAAASLLDDEAGLIAPTATAADDLAANEADDVVGDGSLDSTPVAAAETVATADAEVELAQTMVSDLDIEPATPPGVPIPYPNQVDGPAEMADASTLLAASDVTTSRADADDLDGDGAPDFAADAGVETLEG